METSQRLEGGGTGKWEPGDGKSEERRRIKQPEVAGAEAAKRKDGWRVLGAEIKGGPPGDSLAGNREERGASAAALAPDTAREV